VGRVRANAYTGAGLRAHGKGRAPAFAQSRRVQSCCRESGGPTLARMHCAQPAQSSWVVEEVDDSRLDYVVVLSGIESISYDDMSSRLLFV